MPKNKVALQKKRAELTQRWKRVMDKDTEILKAIALKRAERKMLDLELRKIEKEYGELVKDFDEPRFFGNRINAKTKK